MAPSDREQEVFPSQYGENVPLSISAAHVGTPHNGVGPLYVYLWSLLGKLGANEAYPVGHGKDVFGLYPGLVRVKYPIGEAPKLATTFINQFLKVRGDFLTDFLLLRWVHSTDKSWWGKMVGFILTELQDLLKQVGLYHVVKVIQYGLP